MLTSHGYFVMQTHQVDKSLSVEPGIWQLSGYEVLTSSPAHKYKESWEQDNKTRDSEGKVHKFYK